MNTRHPIQASDQPAVLSIAFSQSRRRILIGTTQDCRILQNKDCLERYRFPNETTPTSVANVPFSVVAILDEQFFAFVQDDPSMARSQHILQVWNIRDNVEALRADCHEPILGIRMNTTCCTVFLTERCIIFRYARLETGVGAKVHSLHRTAANSYALGVLTRDYLLLPAQTPGQVQLIPLLSGSKRVFKAHNTQLRALAASQDGSLVATSSVQGTLIRVFDTATLDKVAEFRRGVDGAIIYSLAISPGNRWVVCTSDKGTIHVFDLRPQSVPSEITSIPQSARARPPSMISPSIDSAARASPPASVQYQGSVQEYYGLLPPPSVVGPTSQTSTVAALSNAFKQSSLAPRALRDVRSIVSMPFHMGEESRHWQGGPAFKWTVGPDGKKKRVSTPVRPLPNDPTGKPPKGLLNFTPDKLDDNDGFVLYVLAGGSDHKWERFRLIRSDGEWKLINEGFRRYLTKQFTE